MQMKQMYQGYPRGYKQMYEEPPLPQVQEKKPSFWENLWGGIKTIGGSLLSPIVGNLANKATEKLISKAGEWGGKLQEKGGQLLDKGISSLSGGIGKFLGKF